MSDRHGVMKLTNPYARQLAPDLYTQIPKAVFAAMAVSLASCGGDRLDEAEERIREEWWCLFENGIVPQKPPFHRPEPRDEVEVRL